MTSIQHRLLVDECLPPELLDRYIKPQIKLDDLPIEAVHFYKKYGRKGKWKDKDFIPDLARDHRWFVLTSDRGSQSHYLDNMRLLCAEHKVRLLYLSPAVKEKGLSFYGRQFLAHWESLLDAAGGPRGAQYTIRMHEDKHSAFETRLCPDGYELKKGKCEKRE